MMASGSVKTDYSQLMSEFRRHGFIHYHLRRQLKALKSDVIEINIELDDIRDQIFQIKSQSMIFTRRAIKLRQRGASVKAAKYDRRIATLHDDYVELDRRREEIRAERDALQIEVKQTTSDMRRSQTSLEWARRQLGFPSIVKGELNEGETLDVLSSMPLGVVAVSAPTDCMIVHDVSGYHIYWDGLDSPVGEGHGHVIMADDLKAILHQRSPVAAENASS